jgi:hygromycin-B 4-O-kinase
VSDKPTLSIETLQDVVRTRFSAAAGPLQQLIEGEESQAFWFRDSGGDFVLRVHASPEGFWKDAYARAHFASPDLPIPEVLEVGQIDPAHAFCVSQKLPGVTLQDCSDETIDRLLGQTDNVLRCIHDCDVSGTTGYGNFDASGAGKFATWRAFLLSVLTPKDDQWPLVRERSDPHLVDDLIHAVERLTAHCPEERRLIHADFGSNNVLTDGQSITGVLDWEEAAYGDPVFDLRSFWSPWLTCIRKQTDYWDKTAFTIPNYRERKLCYDLRTGLAEIYENALDGGTKTLRWVERRSWELLGSHVL